MKPDNLKTRIFLDSGSFDETKEILDILGFIDGQTTNPSYFAQSPHIQKRLETEGKFSKEEVYQAYKDTVQKVSNLIPDGSVSIEVYADKTTTAEGMITQAREMFGWIPNAHIKFPITSEGLKAAQMAVKEGIRVNMTLCFAQEQAAAVYVATKGAKKGDVFVSPFVGRLTDQGLNGVDLIKNIIKMYENGDGHVEVLTASLRGIDQFYATIALGTDIITAGAKYLKQWAADGNTVPDASFKYDPVTTKPIEYQDISLDKDISQYNIFHELTDIGLDKFVEDWNALIK